VTDAPLTRRDVEAKIVALAWQDDAFRRKFVADPKGQFEERLGVQLPEALRMTVHEENENDLHFVLPAKPRLNLAELSDAELEKVAGGTDVIATITTVVSTTITAALTALIIGDELNKSQKWV
jgi:hypothetical protein